MRSFPAIALFVLFAIFMPGGLLEAVGFEATKIVPYKTVDETELSLHVFEPEGHLKSDKRPAIVFFFGGGWHSGSPKQFFPQCAYLAERGMVAIAAEYRVKSRNDTGPDKCVMDGKSAIRWVRTHAAELGIDPEKLLAGGGSAGGHIAAATGILEGFNEPGEDLSVSSKPVAMVLFNPVFDNGPDGFGHRLVKDYWEKFSPLHNITENAPPALVILGTKDKFIPVATAEDFQRRMKASGVRCDLLLYEGQLHGFFNFGRNEFYEITLKEMDDFLVSLGYLKAQAEK